MTEQIINLVFIAALIVLCIYALRMAIAARPEIAGIVILLLFLMTIMLWMQMLKFDFSWIPFLS